jgi:ATP-binding cassette subfamily F protein 3
MTAVSVQNLEKYFGERKLFSKVTFDVAEQDRVGFIGENGCGKTTLFRMLIGEESVDGGCVIRSKETRFGYMEQHTCAHSNRTLYEEVESVFSPVIAVEKELQAVNDRIAKGETNNTLLEQQQTLREQFENMGGLYYKNRVRATLLGLGFSEQALTQSVASLSGGQRSKAAMAKLLLSDANFLLLDEPTNHLDIQAVEWLEEYLRGYKGAAIIISHDRYFLDRVTEKTIELSGGKLYYSNGNYSAHKALREKNREVEEKHYETAMQEIRRIEENIALLKQWNREKSVRTAESKEKMVERLKADLIVPEARRDTVHFTFEAAETGGNEVLTAGELEMGFDGNPLFKNVGFHLHRGDRVCLLGPNGCGKTTLLKILNGRLDPQKGFVRFGAKISVGYYDQIQENLNQNNTAIGELSDAFPQMTATQLRNAMAAFLFRGDDVFKPVSLLSGGEKARLLLLKLMLKKHNVLLLDEPTNHLDIPSREALEQALLGYTGTVLMVSHDRYFINRLAGRILRLTPDGCLLFDGDYDTYISRYREQPTVPQVKEREKKENTYLQQKELASRRRKLNTQLIRTEERIEQLEQAISELETGLTQGVDLEYMALMEMTQRLDRAHTDLDESMALWAEISEELESLS